MTPGPVLGRGAGVGPVSVAGTEPTVIDGADCTDVVGTVDLPGGWVA